MDFFAVSVQCNYTQARSWF